MSIDHHGRAYNNIFIERLWCSLKYENIYLQGYENPREALIGIRSYLKYYNYERPHQSLKYNTPLKYILKARLFTFLCQNYTFR
ncbi:integrase core domain-containing protein [Clostridium sp. WILCCON 0269]|uniref:Integrase core domain-containing protein n=1 Tax=Candidatus Clostridium eludens TaxID=3381663 RepID=A0ABW8SK17_9CLOT